MKKVVALLVATVGLISLDAQAQEGNPTTTAPKIQPQEVFSNVNQPYYAVKTKDKLTVISTHGKEKLNTSWIERVDVYTAQEAVELFGEQAKDGAVIITVKEAKEEDVLEILTKHR